MKTLQADENPCCKPANVCSSPGLCPHAANNNSCFEGVSSVRPTWPRVRGGERSSRVREPKREAPLKPTAGLLLLLPPMPTVGSTGKMALGDASPRGRPGVAKTSTCDCDDPPLKYENSWHWGASKGRGSGAEKRLSPCNASKSNSLCHPSGVGFHPCGPKAAAAGSGCHVWRGNSWSSCGTIGGTTGSNTNCVLPHDPAPMKGLGAVWPGWPCGLRLPDGTGDGGNCNGDVGAVCNC